MLVRLAHLAHRAPRRVLLAVLLLALAAGAAGAGVAERLDPYSAEDPATDSAQVDRRLYRVQGADPDAGVIALVDADAPVSSGRGRRRVERVAALLRRDPAIGRVTTPWDRGRRAMVARDGRSAYVVASFRARSPKAQQEAAERVIERLERVPGVTLGGEAVGNRQLNEQVSEDLERAELMALPLLFVLSLVFFRGFVAAALPPLTGGLAIVLTLAAIRGFSELSDVSLYALNLVTGLGLGLAIDYSLFMVSRYREELARHGPGLAALEATLTSAGRTVLFSSLIVAAALASLLVFPQEFLYSMGLGGLTVALIASAVALVALPALLALLGPRVNALAPRRLRRAAEAETRVNERGRWYRLARGVMRRPLPVATFTALALVLVGLPFAEIRFVGVDSEVLPRDTSARIVGERLDREFPLPNASRPLRAVVRDADPDALRAWTARVRRLERVSFVSPPRYLSSRTALVEIAPAVPPLSERAQALVRDVRGLPAPFGVQVGGASAELVDLKRSLVDHLPLAVAIVVTGALVLLFALTGSVVLPLKTLVLNFATLSATFGLLVLIFQDGRLEGLLGYESQGGLELTQPVLLFALAFGLATDYGVFLLSRIKEAHDRGLSDDAAVAVGLERTGRIVTAAAILFAVAVGSFASSEIVFIKQVGLGTALAVLIDATIVRALLVPSLMALLGQRNWWAPAALRRAHARFGLRETAGPRAAPVGGAES